MTKYIPILLTAILLACQSSTQQKEEVDLDELRKEVLAIHDEVMPKMGTLKRVKNSLLLQADSLGATDSLSTTLRETADAIAVANENMMAWMRQYEPAFEGTDEEVLRYLQEQKSSIEKVQKDMLESLAKGEALLGGE